MPEIILEFGVGSYSSISVENLSILFGLSDLLKGEKSEGENNEQGGRSLGNLVDADDWGLVSSGGKRFLGDENCIVGERSGKEKVKEWVSGLKVTKFEKGEEHHDFVDESKFLEGEVGSNRK